MSPKATNPDLPDAELDILACLWQKGKATAREVRETIWPYRPMTHGALVTLLKRLESKNLVTREKGPVGKAFVFSPAKSPKPTYRRLVAQMRDRLFGGSGVTMVASLFESRRPTQDELDQLQELLDQLRKDAEKRKRGK